jgi:tRNA-Thr(GGU) m(6)t(6)A37 methyltransferase TsaA
MSSTGKIPAAAPSILQRKRTLDGGARIHLSARVNPAPPLTLTLQPIGYVRTAQRVKFQARHQPVDDAQDEHLLELLPGHDYQSALRDLAGFDRIWLIWQFHRNTTWRPLVLPPRGPAQRRGVFATRSPHRPNPLGLTPVRLLAIEGLSLRLGPCDLVDGTPVFDIKPYVPSYDSFPGDKAGWIDAVDAAMEEPPRFTVEFAPLASEQAEWLRGTWGVDFTARLQELLGRDPAPHRTRRIRRSEAGQYEIGCGAWKALFVVEAWTVRVNALETGYPRRFLMRDAQGEVPDHDAQVAFMERWGEGSWVRAAGA